MDSIIMAGGFEVAWNLHQARSDCDIITALKTCSRKWRRWEFTEWAYVCHRDEFVLVIGGHLFRD
jgi:hypothetical protein